VRAILADEEYVTDLEHFLAEHRIVERGRCNSLAQTALLLTCPGVPDVYQGSELWDLSVVDPDNRRPVDYELRRRLLAGLADQPVPPADDHTGEGKLRLVHQVLTHRRARPEAYGGYEPLPAPDDAVAFTRGGVVTVVPCRTGSTMGDEVELPPGGWVDLVTGARVDGGRHGVESLLRRFPVAVLAKEEG
jgi:(1->4)-alpha-D-glucan 1-alpha-D-glucosylmutase